MEAPRVYTAIGLMSGTSFDAIDAALIKTDGETVFFRGASYMMPYADAMRSRIRDAIKTLSGIKELERDLTLLHAEAVTGLLKEAGLSPDEVDVIGFHGQTILHKPHEGITWQLGNGALLAAKTGIDVVCDFRSRDVAEGGHGAPLVPIYHQALVADMPKPVAVLNIGGVANVTLIQEDAPLRAFDTGPGNALLDDWIHRHSNSSLGYDADGQISLSGQVNEAALHALLADPYFTKTDPKSLDRQHFSVAPVQGLSLSDGAATLAAFTSEAIHKGIVQSGISPERIIVCGGGRKNRAMMERLEQHGYMVQNADTLGWNGDMLEAEAFAFLAVRSLRGLPLSEPGTTGVTSAVTGGAFYRA